MVPCRFLSHSIELREWHETDSVLTRGRVTNPKATTSLNPLDFLDRARGKGKGRGKGRGQGKGRGRGQGRGKGRGKGRGRGRARARAGAGAGGRQGQGQGQGEGRGRGKGKGNSLNPLGNLLSFTVSSSALAQMLLYHAHHCLCVVKVPNSNDSHILRPVPALVEGQDLPSRNPLNDVFLADW